MKSKRVLVTGGNSLLGSNTILELINQGYDVKALIRNNSKILIPSVDKIEIIRGDITNLNDLFKAFKDVDFVVHNAGITDQGLRNFKEYEAINIKGTENVLKAAVTNKINRVIYVSSANVYGFGGLNNPGAESNPMKSPFTGSHYSRSKKIAQNLVLSFANKVEVVIVNPTFIIGPYDSKPSSGKIVLMGLKRKCVFAPPGGKNFVNAKDVSKGIVKAIEKGISGESYLLSNENLSYVQFFKRLRRACPNKFIIIPIPNTLMYVLGALGELIRGLGFNSSLTLGNIKALCLDTYYSNFKSIDKLGMSYQPIDNGISQSIEWFNTTKTISHETN